VCDIFLPQCKVNLVAVHTAGAVRVPDAASSAGDIWAPAQQRTTPRRRGALRCVRGTRLAIRSINMPSRSRGWIRPSFAVRFALVENKGRREGRAPAGTQGPHTRDARGV